MNDFRISINSTKGMNVETLICILSDEIWPSTENEDTIEHISTGTPGQSAFFSIILFMREVDNGGLEQFLDNSSGKYINEVLKGLELIECFERLTVLKEAITIFPNSIVPIDRNKRQNILAFELKKRNLTVESYFESFNIKLFHEQLLYPFMFKYQNEHKNEFYFDANEL